jgi:hypothetical protein
MDSAIPVLAIRPATEHDVPELARLFTALGHPATAEAIAERGRERAAAGNTALVAPRRDGALAGAATLHRMVVLHRPRPVGRITALVVDTPLRGARGRPRPRRVPTRRVICPPSAADRWRGEGEKTARPVRRAGSQQHRFQFKECAQQFVRNGQCSGGDRPYE